MEALASTPGRFEVPDIPADVRADMAAWAAEEDERIARAERETRIAQSCIPAEFKQAETEDERILEWCRDPGYGLILQGDQGRGKSYAACAALKVLASAMRIRFASFGTVIREWEAVREDMTSHRSVVCALSSVGALCLDNLGREKLNTMTVALLAEIVDRRTQAMRPTIITTTLDGAAFMGWLMEAGRPEVAKDISSRLSRYACIHMDGADRRRHG